MWTHELLWLLRRRTRLLALQRHCTCFKYVFSFVVLTFKVKYELESNCKTMHQGQSATAWMSSRHTLTQLAGNLLLIVHETKLLFEGSKVARVKRGL